MQKADVPVAYAYVSDAHDNHTRLEGGVVIRERQARSLIDQADTLAASS